MNGYFRNITHRLFSKGSAPYWIILAMDCCIVVFAGVVSSMFVNGIVPSAEKLLELIGTWCVYLVGYMIGFRWQHTYSGVLRYSSFVDLMRVMLANLMGIVIIFVVHHALPIDNWLVGITWKELPCSLVISTAIMGGIRVIVKYLYDVLYVSMEAQRVFIYGVKEGGIALAKSIRSQESQFVVRGFVSDDKHDTSHMLMSSKIYLNDKSLIANMRQHGATTLVVSPLKTEALRNNQKMIDMLSQAGIKIMLYSQQEWDGKSDLRYTQLKEVDIEDLLPRDQIEVDLDAIAQILTGKSVLVTGAAGSIGSEIVRLVATFRPARLTLVDQAETPLHDIRLMMATKFPDIPCETITMSICHRGHMERIFQLYKPEYVFHAAAYKHVPMMEDNPTEAVANNIDGTRTMADLAVKHGVTKFVMISTDKAVNPTNVMGASKRICEMYCQSLNKAIADGKIPGGKTQFVTTRFGNVLGSNGSVIPLFKEQIKNGGPLTVTHPEIIRYFMLIPEACKLVLQAGSMGHGGEIFVFDMGKPVKIADLAQRMILLSGASDIEIKYTGLRDGEKLYEELLNNEENTKPSAHPKIKIAEVRELGYEEVSTQIDRLVEITRHSFDDMEIVRQMKVLVPEFKSKNSKYELLDAETASTAIKA